MAKIQYIKHLRDSEDKSISKIANEMNIDWRTAKKYADCEDWNVEIGVPLQRKYPVMDPYLEQIDTWLMEDQNRPRKQRHTAAQ